MSDEEVTSRIANQWIDAFNRHDIDVLLALYSDTAEHYSPKLRARQPETRGIVKGKEKMRAWWQDSFDRLPSLRYELIRLTCQKNRVFMEYIRHVQGEETLRVGEMFEIRDTKIVASRVYHS
jgi:hypothetical protein